MITLFLKNLEIYIYIVTRLIQSKLLCMFYLQNILQIWKWGPYDIQLCVLFWLTQQNYYSRVIFPLPPKAAHEGGVINEVSTFLKFGDRFFFMLAVLYYKLSKLWTFLPLTLPPPNVLASFVKAPKESSRVNFPRQKSSFILSLRRELVVLKRFFFLYGFL